MDCLSANSHSGSGWVLGRFHVREVSLKLEKMERELRPRPSWSIQQRAN